MTSAIAPLVSHCNRLKQAPSRCSGLFDPVFSKIHEAQTVSVTLKKSCGTMSLWVFM